MNATLRKERGHDRKRMYLTRRDAKRVARLFRGTRLWVYRCDFCPGFHLTSRRPDA